MKLFISLFIIVLLFSQCDIFNKAAKPIEFINSENIVLPLDREAVTVDSDENSYANIALCRGEIFGDWVILSVFDKAAKGETTPYLKFDKPTGEVYGNNGCNVINGKYSYNIQDSTFKFSDVITTMRMCGMTDITDFDINSAISMTERYSWESEGINNFLILLDKNNVELMRLRHQNFDFLNGSWIVKSIEDQPQDNPEMKLVFDIQEQSLHGNTGCNIINGSIETNMGSENAISFQQIISTQRACPDVKGETSLLVALEDATYIEPIDANTVKLLNNNNQPVLKLIRDN